MTVMTDTVAFILLISKVLILFSVEHVIIAERV